MNEINNPTPVVPDGPGATPIVPSGPTLSQQMSAILIEIGDYKEQLARLESVITQAQARYDELAGQVGNP